MAHSTQVLDSVSGGEHSKECNMRLPVYRTDGRLETFPSHVLNQDNYNQNAQNKGVACPMHSTSNSTSRQDTCTTHI